MKKNYKKLALKKIFLLFIIVSSCFLISDYMVSTKIKPAPTIIKTKIIIENTIKNSLILNIVTQQEITKSLIFRELGVVMERTEPSIYVGKLITNDLMDNRKKISIIEDEIERILQQIDEDINRFIKSTSAAPNSPFLGTIQKRNTELTKLKSVKYAIDNNFEFILVKYEENIKLMKKNSKSSKIFRYIYYLILSIIISLFISYFTTSRQLQKYNNIIKKFI
tara:strand:- start:2999 stop:3664 length:666 start_codon:yes stop_codon:yes gene_type:complete